MSSAVATPASWNADRRDNRAVPRHQGHDVQDDGTVVWNTGVGDTIAQVLRKYSDELERL